MKRSGTSTDTGERQGRDSARLFMVIVLLQLALTVLSIQVLCAVRAYVAGESHYAKGHKDALLHLQRYAQTQEEAEYQGFVQALKVPEGDARARRALQQSPRQWQAAREGFLAGGNHADDVEGLIQLFVVAEDLPFFARAVDIWTEADAVIAQLRASGERARAELLAGQQDSSSLERLQAELPALNLRLTALERAFSAQLLEAAQITERSLLLLNLLSALGLALLGGITLRRSLQAQRQREAEMVALVGAVGDAMLTVDAQQRVVLFNPAAAALFGCAPEAARGAALQRFLPTGLEPGSSERVQTCEGLRADGQRLQLEVSLAPLHTAQGLHTSLVCRDVTERRQAEQQERQQLLQRNAWLAQKASTDALTGLPNREALERHLGECLATAQAAGQRLALIFLDLDGFKAINDGHGHLSGDELLRQVATRLREAVRQGDEVFRLGGDEFVIVVTRDVDSAQAVVRRVLAALGQPYALRSAQVQITASIGLAHFPDNGADTAALLQAADAAMYRAKQGGKNGFHLAP